MAKPRQHIEQWCHNRQFLSAIPSAYPDWIITVTFYTALHAVDALLAHDGVFVTTHTERNSVLVRTNRYKQVWKHYSQLYDLSRTVRYLADPARWTPASILMAEVIQGLLYPVEQSVTKLSGEDPPLKPIVLCAEEGTP